VKPNRQFVIPFKGLATGNHDFVFEIDDKFFEDFKESEITKSKILAKVNLRKMVNMLELDFTLSGTVIVICDRCLDEFEMLLDYQTKLFVKFGESNQEQSDEIIVLSYTEGELDIKQYIYEYIHLSLPYKRVHPNDKKGNSLCNKGMLKKLNEYSMGEKLDNQNILKNLMNQN
jgi:uncharacterized protein